MNVCIKCVIPRNFPGASFDEEGVCNFCRESPSPSSAPASPRLLPELLKRTRSAAGQYDCIVCYSGGKDSTYTLKTLVQDYGLKVLAFTFEHGFTSRTALENIDRVTRSLKVESELYRPDADNVRKIFQVAIRELPSMPLESIYGRGMREYGPVCYVCGCMIHSIAIRIAMRTSTPLIATGYTPSQDPSYYRGYTNRGTPVELPSAMSAEPWREISNIMYRFLHHWQIDGIKDYFLEGVSREDLNAIFFLRLFDFIEYDEQRIIEEIRDLGWERPPDTDSCSTNCLLNSLGIYVYQKAMGYHLYTKQLAELVRMGRVAREYALKTLQAELDMNLIGKLARQIGVVL